MAVCQSCRQALLLLSGEIGPDVDPEELPSRPAPVLWPAAGRDLADGVPPLVMAELVDARVCVRTGSTAAAAVHVRRLLEAICADHGIEARTLYQALGRLCRARVIDGWMVGLVEELRETCNAGIHLGDKLSKDEGADIVTLAEALVEYIYVLKTKYDRIKGRRPKREVREPVQETTAIRILRKYHVAFSVHPYPHEPGRTKSRAAVAAGLGIPPVRMLKAVILYLGEHAVLAIAPVEGEVDEPALARAFGGHAARIATTADVVRINDTIAADILSPLALPYLPSVLDSSAAGADSVYVSSGRHGLELELDPADLIRITSARLAKIVK